MTVRPPYRVPLMAEVEALKGKNGLTVASTFSGCGGSCLGLEMAGFDIRWACEFVPEAQETYRVNHQSVHLECRDIRLVEPGDVLAAAFLRVGELDVLEGSPPCASFSTAGKRDKGWGKTKKYSDTSQRSDDLFFEFVRLLRGLKPRSFIAENVSGLIKGTAKGYFKLIMEALRASGYRVACRLLDAQWLGVPQARQRVIFIGFREDLGLDPLLAYPTPLTYSYSIRDAMYGLPGWGAGESRCIHDTSGLWSTGDVTDTPSPTVTVGVNSVNSNHFKVVSVGGDMRGTAVGAEWGKLSPGEASKKYFQLVRPRADAPSPTITALGGHRRLASVTHPFEARKFSIAELRRVCAFPDDFELTGAYTQQWERLGRSVPPLMMRAVGESLAVALGGA